MNTVKVVENGVEAKKMIEQFNQQGFMKDDIYSLTQYEKELDHGRVVLIASTQP